MFNKGCQRTHQESVEGVLSSVFIFSEGQDPEGQQVPDDPGKPDGEEDDPAHPEVEGHQDVFHVGDVVVALQEDTAIISTRNVFLSMRPPSPTPNPKNQCCEVLIC